MNKVGNRLRIRFHNPFAFHKGHSLFWTGYMQFGLHLNRHRAFAHRFSSRVIAIEWGVYVDDVAVSQMRWAAE